MNSRKLVGALMLSMTIIASLAFGSLVNAQTAVIPPWVIKSGGNIFGFFISIDGSNIHFGMKDGTTTIPLQIRKSVGAMYLEGNEPRVYYTDLNCAGTVYLNDHLSDAVKAGTTLLGATYAVGQKPGIPATLQLFKGTGPAVADPGLQSSFSNGTCGTFIIGTTFRTVTVIDDFPFGTPIPNGTLTME